MRHHHHQRELGPRPNRGVVSNLTSAWKDEQKQLKAAPKDDESTTTTKEQTYSGDFAVPPMIAGREKPSLNSSPYSPDTTTEDQTSNGKIHLSRNLRLQNIIHSAVKKLSSEPNTAGTNVAIDTGSNGTTSKGKKGVAKSVKKSVRSIFGKTDDGGRGGGEEEEKEEEPQGQLEQSPESGGKAPHKKADEQDLDSSRHQANIRSRTEGSVCRRRRRDAERQKRLGARNYVSPKRSSRPSSVSNAAEEPRGTRRGHSTETGDERERHRQSSDTSDTLSTSLASFLEDAKATQEIVSAAKQESTTIEPSFDRLLGDTGSEESEHTRSTILDFPLSSLNDFPGVNLPTDIKPKTSLVVGLLDSMHGSSRHDSKSSALQDSSHRQQLLEYPKVLQDPKAKQSTALDKKSSHHRRRNKSRIRDRDSDRHAAAAVNEPEIPLLYLHPSDSELEYSTSSLFSETPSASRGPHKARKQKSRSSGTRNTAPSDRSRKERSVSGISRGERNKGTRISSQDLVDEMDRSSFTSSSRTRRERKKMSASDSTHVRKSRSGSYGALRFEQWSPKRSKSLSRGRVKSSSAREDEPIEDNPPKRSSSASAQKTRRKASSDKKQNRRQLEVEKEARATGQDIAALPNLLPLAVTGDGKALATKASGRPDVPPNATVLDLPRAASFLSATSTLQSSSFHPPLAEQLVRERDKTMSISYHGKAAGERSTSLPPKSDQRGERSSVPGVTKKRYKKTPTKEKSKASGQKDPKDRDLAARDHEKARLSNSASKDRTSSKDHSDSKDEVKSERKQKHSGRQRSSSVSRIADDSMPKRKTSSKTKDGLMSFSLH